MGLRHREVKRFEHKSRPEDRDDDSHADQKRACHQVYPPERAGCPRHPDRTRPVPEDGQRNGTVDKGAERDGQADTCADDRGLPNNGGTGVMRAR